MTHNSAVDPNSEDFDFSSWSLGNGKMKDKRAKLENLLGQLVDRNNRKLKKDLDTYCNGIKRKRNRGASLRAKDSKQISMMQDRSHFEGHTNMITQMHGEIDGVDEGVEFELAVNNDFIGKNKNMLAFYREHE